MTIKKIKAWAVLLTDKNRYECSFSFKREAELYAQQFYGAKVISCTVIYTIPIKKRK